MTFIMNITSSRFKFTTPFCHVLPVHNISAVNRKKISDEFQQQFLLSREEIELLHELPIWQDFELTRPF
jgi:hypothetical protein